VNRTISDFFPRRGRAGRSGGQNQAAAQRPSHRRRDRFRRFQGHSFLRSRRADPSDRPGQGQEKLLVQVQGVVVGHAGDESPTRISSGSPGRIVLDVLAGVAQGLIEKIADDLFSFAQLVAGEFVEINPLVEKLRARPQLS